jgi:hypothetical protein
MIFCFIWGVVFYFLAFVISKFYFFSLGLIPLTIYELIRVEGKKNTRPLSFLTLLVLIFQFLHTSKIYLFPMDVSFIIEILPFPFPTYVDQVLFLSVILLIIFALLLIRYTWGSVTKFLAIMLLVGALIQTYLFWPDIQLMMQTPSGQRLMEGTKEKIRDNLYYRLRRELY